MGIEGGGPCRFIFLLRKQSLQLLPLRPPLAGFLQCENLRNTTPTDVFDKNPSFFIRCRAFLGIELSRQFNGCEIVPALLLQRARAETISLADAVIIAI